jgi:hypothetical protein
MFSFLRKHPVKVHGVSWFFSYNNLKHIAKTAYHKPEIILQADTAGGLSKMVVEKSLEVSKAK